mgnify:CR=1 FL=1
MWLEYRRSNTSNGRYFKTWENTWGWRKWMRKNQDYNILKKHKLHLINFSFFGIFRLRFCCRFMFCSGQMFIIITFFAEFSMSFRLNDNVLELIETSSVCLQIQNFFLFASRLLYRKPNWCSRTKANLPKSSIPVRKCSKTSCRWG